MATFSVIKSSAFQLPPLLLSLCLFSFVSVAMAEEATNGAAAKVTFTAFKPQLMVWEGKADEAVAFYKNAFAAEEVNRVNHPKRKAEQDAPLLLCAELKIGGGSLLVCDQLDDSSIGKTGTNVGGGVLFRLEAEDVAATVAYAVKAGAVQEGEITEEEGSCGRRGGVGKVKDPFGHIWEITVADKCCAAELEA